jgi:hypothetical protein
MIFLAFYGGVWFVDGIDSFSIVGESSLLRAVRSLGSSRAPPVVFAEGF